MAQVRQPFVGYSNSSSYRSIMDVDCGLIKIVDYYNVSRLSLAAHYMDFFSIFMGDFCEQNNILQHIVRACFLIVRVISYFFDNSR